MSIRKVFGGGKSEINTGQGCMVSAQDAPTLSAEARKRLKEELEATNALLAVAKGGSDDQIKAARAAMTQYYLKNLPPQFRRGR